MAMSCDAGMVVIASMLRFRRGSHCKLSTCFHFADGGPGDPDSHMPISRQREKYRSLRRLPGESRISQEGHGVRT
jgi:hypothetical protein